MKFNEKEISFIRENAANNTVKSLVPLFNKEFNREVSYQQIKGLCRRRCIRAQKKQFRRWTEKEISFIRKNAAGNTVKSLVPLFNKEFNREVSYQQIINICYRRYIPFEKRQYKDRDKYQLNTEREQGGLIYIKTTTTGRKWEKKHILIWKNANGKIPQGNALIFIDKNPLNCTLENLAMVNNRELQILAYNNLRFENRELSLAGIALAKHTLAIRELQKQNLNCLNFTGGVKHEKTGII